MPCTGTWTPGWHQRPDGFWEYVKIQDWSKGLYVYRDRFEEHDPFADPYPIVLGGQPSLIEYMAHTSYYEWAEGEHQVPSPMGFSAMRILHSDPTKPENPAQPYRCVEFIWFMADNCLHNEQGPALLKVRPDGSILHASWWLNDEPQGELGKGERKDTDLSEYVRDLLDKAEPYMEGLHTSHNQPELEIQF